MELCSSPRFKNIRSRSTSISYDGCEATISFAICAVFIWASQMQALANVYAPLGQTGDRVPEIEPHRLWTQKSQLIFDAEPHASDETVPCVATKDHVHESWVQVQWKIQSVWCWSFTILIETNRVKEGSKGYQSADSKHQIYCANRKRTVKISAL